MPVASSLVLSVDQARRNLAAALMTLPPEALEAGHLFANAGYEVALVGGWVRDALLGRPVDAADLDLTTDARPDDIDRVVRGWADHVWDVGIKFGTVGVLKGEARFEITTYRADLYVSGSRKPEVSFGETLAEDLIRRDFTMNALAVRLPDLEFIDESGGFDDVLDGVLRTPGSPEQSFGDDPLRMLRAARFVSQLGVEVAPNVIEAMSAMRERLEIISAERIRDEITKLIMGDYPRRGLALMVATGLAELVLPELPLLQLEVDEHHRHKDVYEHSLIVLEQAMELETSHDPKTGPDLVLRLAALLHDVGKPRTRRFEDGGGVSFHHHEVVGARMVKKRLTALRFPSAIIDEVSELVALHLRFHGYGTGEWTDSAVRRYVRDAGPLLDRLHKLTRADCTTRNKRRAQALSDAYDSLEARIARLSEEEEMAAIRPDLDGAAIMEILGLTPGPIVGEAYRHLLEIRLDQGPLTRDEAEAELRAWWAARG